MTASIKLALVFAAAMVSARSSSGDRPWMRDPEADPAQRAKQLLANMTLAEKVHMLHGSGSGYVGNVLANDRLGIPAIKLNDGPQGFRGIPGTSTAWPSAMSIAATWDEDLALQWGGAMGQEFYDKGANVQLGPGMCVARVPRNGRNFEYLSGEDPYFGFRMVQPAVTGIQSKGVVANAKHYINNNQEDYRFTINEVLDERTEYEMYLPPFEGAIKANVGSVMCSYNKINGPWSCENNETLNTHLKGRLGFEGWVMSDWLATHSTSINKGLDMEMPGDNYMGDQAITDLINNGQVTESKVDDSVVRILTPMFAVGLFDNPSQGNLDVNTTSLANNALARQLAASGAVLLKNDGLLPLSLNSSLKIAVIGSQATSPTVHGGGSGSVYPYYTSSPLDALRERLFNTSVPGSECDKSGKYCVYYAADGQAATDAAKKADIAIVFAFTDSTEGHDRANLSLNAGGDALISQVAQVQSNTIAVVVTPGALLTPWSHDVSAVLAMFMPGQEYGHAVTDVLFGNVNPSARLPVTFPNKENEVGFTPEQWPGVNLTSTYSEKLEIGYRWYDAHKVTPKFAFGYGLSYSSFSYSDLQVARNVVTCIVKNTGQLDGAEVAQLYLGFPESAGEPPMQLKGFSKVNLKAGESAPVYFGIDDRSFSIWDTDSHSWKVVKGTYEIAIGGSSRDVQLQGSLTK